MSLGYAQKLSYKEDVGTVGMPEIFDPPLVLQQKIDELVSMIGQHLVAFTGAGISTSCGIPDFRGPKGVWTLQHEGKGVPEASVPVDRAMPSFTHMALVELEKTGILKFVISQNVDSLHLRSGIPREKLAELHGNSFKEFCRSCGAEYLRDFEVETIGLKETPRRCSDVKCRARLRDTVLDWEDALPSREMIAAEKHCRMADIVLCLGTSLQITPACNRPLKCLRGGGKIVIVNLQPTPKDKKACLVIHEFIDKVIAGVMHHLNLWISPYVRVDLFKVIYQFHCIEERKYAKWSLRVISVHGERAPLPFIKSVEVLFPERPELKVAVLQKQPFLLKREILKSRPLKMVLKINFGDGCGCPFISIGFSINFQEATDSISHKKEMVVQKLKDIAVQEQCCGQFLVIERKPLSGEKKEISTYAVATNLVRYGGSEQNGKPFLNHDGKRAKKEVNFNGNSYWMTEHEGKGPMKKLRVHR